MSRYAGISLAFVLGLAAATLSSQAPAGPDMNAHYQFGPDSQARDGVPKGEVRGPFVIPIQAYPGTQHTYWVYVPAQYDAAVPRLMKAFTEKGYDVNYAWGLNTHGQRMGGPMMPEMMRWLWRDQPVSTDPNDAVERGYNEPKKRTSGSE